MQKYYWVGFLVNIGTLMRDVCGKLFMKYVNQYFRALVAIGIMSLAGCVTDEPVAFEGEASNLNLYNAASRKCISSSVSSAVESDCTFKGDQVFKLEEVGPKIYIIKNHNGNCLEVPDNSRDNGAIVKFASCTGKDNQKITLRNSQPNNLFRNIVFRHSEKCLELVESDGLQDLQQITCSQNPSQNFFLNSSIKNDKLPHIIWSFWDGGEASMPAFYKANVEHWKKHLEMHEMGEPWTVKVLNNIPGTPNYFGNFIDVKSIPTTDSLDSKISSVEKLNKNVVFSDFLRLELLYEHGGVYIDPSVMKHKALKNLESALRMSQFSLAGYATFRQGNADIHYADSLENFFMMALPKSQLIKTWKTNFRHYWDRKEPNMHIEDHPMYNGSEGKRLDTTKFGDLSNYLNQHIALKYTLENHANLLPEVYIIGDTGIKDRGPFTLLILADWEDKNLLDLKPAKFTEILTVMKDVMISKFPSKNSEALRAIKDIKYFFNTNNIFGMLNQIDNWEPVRKTVWGFWDSGEDNLPAFNKYAVDHWRTMLEPAGYEIRILNLKEGDKDNAITVLGGKGLLPSNWNNLDNIVKPFTGPDGNQVKMVPSIVKSDLIRLALLEKFGGIWMDTSNALLRPLDTIVVDDLNASNKTVAGYVMDRYASADSPRVDGIPVDGMENWLIVAKRGSPLIKAWRKAFVDYWETRKVGEWIQNHELYKKETTFTFGGLGNVAANYLNQHAALKYVLHVNPAIYSHIYPIKDLHPWWLHNRAEHDHKSVYQEIIAPNMNTLASEITTDKVGLMKFAGSHLTEINDHFKKIDDYCSTANLITLLYGHCP